MLEMNYNDTTDTFAARLDGTQFASGSGWDLGGGLEGLAAAVNDDPDIFKIDLVYPLIKKIESISN